MEIALTQNMLNGIGNSSMLQIQIKSNRIAHGIRFDFEPISCARCGIWLSSAECKV